MRELVIQPSEKGKGRAFTSTLVSYVLANGLWAGGQTTTETNRPVWWMLAGTDNELRPFIANLRLGRKAEDYRSRSNRHPDRFEVLKSANFQAAWQRTPVGSVVTLFEPELFRLDPGMVDPKQVVFCVLPATSWLSRIQVSDSVRAHLTALDLPIPEEFVDTALRTAPLFAAYLDRRTRCPLIQDQRFYTQILAKALSQGLATWTTEINRYGYGYSRDKFGSHGLHGFHEYNTNVSGLAPGIAFKSSQDALERFLADEVTLYFEMVG